LELCEARDPKGLYKLARAGKIKGKVHMMVGVQNGNSLECLVLPAEQNWFKPEIFLNVNPISGLFCNVRFTA